MVALQYANALGHDGDANVIGHQKPAFTITVCVCFLVHKQLYVLE